MDAAASEPMTLDQAREALLRVADRDVLPGAEIVKCSECRLAPWPLSAREQAVVTQDGYLPLESHAAHARPCSKHRAVKRFAWVADIEPEAYMRFASTHPSAFLIEELRALLRPDAGGFRFL